MSTLRLLSFSLIAAVALLAGMGSLSSPAQAASVSQEVAASGATQTETVPMLSEFPIPVSAEAVPSATWSAADALTVRNLVCMLD